MARSRNPAHANSAAAEAAAADKAITAAPEAGAAPRSASLDALLAADKAAREPRPAGTRKPAAKGARGPTFLDEVTALLREAGVPIKVIAITRWWCDTHPALGLDAKGAREARDTATAARERAEAARAAGDDKGAAEAESAAAEADKRAAEAARAQAEETISSRIYTAVGAGRLAKVGKGEVTTVELATALKVA